MEEQLRKLMEGYHFYRIVSGNEMYKGFLQLIR